MYQIRMMKKPIYKKVVHSSDILSVKYKRAGWTTKAAVIKTKGIFNIRILHFTPDSIFDELDRFATEHEISKNEGV